MFTGLIEHVAEIKDIKYTPQGAVITYFQPEIFHDVKIGDSIATNGVCLTVKSTDNKIISSDIMKESLELTNLKLLKKGDLINLERAMQINSRIAGHIVSGHVDATAVVKDIIKDGFAKRIKFECNTDLIVKKGSIAINGISLTVTEIRDNFFEISLIPLTQNETNLKNIKIGDIVNIEYDMFAKYIKKFMQTSKDKEEESKITLEFLKNNGF